MCYFTYQSDLLKKKKLCPRYRISYLAKPPRCTISIGRVVVWCHMTFTFLYLPNLFSSAHLLTKIMWWTIWMIKKIWIIGIGYVHWQINNKKKIRLSVGTPYSNNSEYLSSDLSKPDSPFVGKSCVRLLGKCFNIFHFCHRLLVRLHCAFYSHWNFMLP